MKSSSLAHIASHYKAHPGEELRLSTRLRYNLPKSAAGGAAADHLDIQEKPAGGATLTVFLPEGVELASYDPLTSQVVRNVTVEDIPDGTAVHWKLAPGIEFSERSKTASQFAEFTCRAVIAHNLTYEYSSPESGRSTFLHSRAELRDVDGMLVDSEALRVVVNNQSRLMRYLPEIYHEAEFLGRFLMLFEGFWQPIEQRIQHSQVFYDPRLAPASFLPWLGEWIGVTLDENLPEQSQRRLLSTAINLYRQRGTRRAMEEILRLYTGGEVKIIEHRASNLVLGSTSRLGPSNALGKENRPHTFTVFLKVSRRVQAGLAGIPETAAGANQTGSNTEIIFRRKIEELINSQRPAHTAFQLKITTVD